MALQLSIGAPANLRSDAAESPSADHEPKQRTILKALTYRLVVTTILWILSWIFTANIDQTSAITISYVILATIAYYFHERIWMRVK